MSTAATELNRVYRTESGGHDGLHYRVGFARESSEGPGKYSIMTVGVGRDGMLYAIVNYYNELEPQEGALYVVNQGKATLQTVSWLGSSEDDEMLSETTKHLMIHPAGCTRDQVDDAWLQAVKQLASITEMPAELTVPR